MVFVFPPLSLFTSLSSHFPSHFSPILLLSHSLFTPLLSLSTLTFQPSLSLSPFASPSHFSPLPLTLTFHPCHFPFSLFTPLHSLYPTCTVQNHSVNDPIERPTDLTDTVISSCNKLSCTEDFQGIRFFFIIIVKYRNYHRCSRNQYRLMLHLMFHLLERSVKLCKDVR